VFAATRAKVAPARASLSTSSLRNVASSSSLPAVSISSGFFMSRLFMMMYGALPIQSKDPAVILDGRFRTDSAYDSNPVHLFARLSCNQRAASASRNVTSPAREGTKKGCSVLEFLTQDERQHRYPRIFHLRLRRGG
jgi:hypothetical protein